MKVDFLGQGPRQQARPAAPGTFRPRRHSTRYENPSVAGHDQPIFAPWPCCQRDRTPELARTEDREPNAGLAPSSPATHCWNSWRREYWLLAPRRPPNAAPRLWSADDPTRGRSLATTRRPTE